MHCTGSRSSGSSFWAAMAVGHAATATRNSPSLGDMTRALHACDFSYSIVHVSNPELMRAIPGRAVVRSGCAPSQSGTKQALTDWAALARALLRGCNVRVWGGPLDD